MASDIEVRAAFIIARKANVDPETLTRETRFEEDLGFSDLDVIELVMAFEEEFGIEIPDGVAERLRTVGQALDYLLNNVPERP